MLESVTREAFGLEGWRIEVITHTYLVPLLVLGSQYVAFREV